MSARKTIGILRHSFSSLLPPWCCSTTEQNWLCMCNFVFQEMLRWLVIQHDLDLHHPQTGNHTAYFYFAFLLWAGENRRICLLCEYLNSRANLIPYGSNRSSFLFFKVFEKCLRTPLDISHGSMKTLCQYFFHGKYCKIRCILQILVFRTHSYYSITCAQGVRQWDVQQIS